MRKLGFYRFCLTLFWFIAVFSLGAFQTNSVNASVNQQGAWIDIPYKQFITQDKSFESVTSLVDQYHSLDKTGLELIDLRIELLEKIIKSIKFTITNESKKDLRNFIRLEPLAEKKLWYLKEIKKIYLDKQIFNRFANTNELESQYIPVFLVNKILFDFKLPTYWGLYQLEIIDPCHRMLTSYYMKWKESKSSAPFFLWLENEEISFRSLQMKFFSDEEIKDSEIIVSDGKFLKPLNKNLINYDDQDKEYIYIISLDKKLFVTAAGELVRHISLSRGRPVLGSGALKIKNGELVYIDAESGHYQPTPEVLYQALLILKEKGAYLDYNKLKVMYYSDHNKITETAKIFTKKYKGSKVQIKSELPNKDFKI